MGGLKVAFPTSNQVIFFLPSLRFVALQVAEHEVDITMKLLADVSIQYVFGVIF
jgi:hypothetical protein